jgi:TetR/AcrR family transcriptional regulator
MVEPESRRGRGSGSGQVQSRARNAEETREAILDAAEEVFAEHGFDGARIDAIAERSGYNKSLIFQYYGDKLGLYTEVLMRADKDMGQLQVKLLAPLLEDSTVAHNAYKLKTVLETMVRAVFDYMVEHPRLVRMLNWEMAEGWQSYGKIISQFREDDTEQLDATFRAAREFGLLRPGFDTILQLTMILQLCLSHIAYIPLFELLLPDEDFSSVQALKSARENIVQFVVAGMMVNPPETEQRD